MNLDEPITNKWTQKEKREYAEQRSPKLLSFYLLQHIPLDEPFKRAEKLELLLTERNLLSGGHYQEMRRIKKQQGNLKVLLYLEKLAIENF